MEILPFTCSKSGRQISPDRAGHCHICGKIFDRLYLKTTIFEDGKHYVCVDDFKEIEKKKPSFKYFIFKCFSFKCILK